MKNIGYKLIKNCTATAEKSPYIGMAIPVGSLGYDDILNRMIDSGTFMSKSTAEYFLKSFYELAGEQIATRGVRVSTGTVSLYPAISGSFPSEDAEFDPTRNTLYVGASLNQDTRDAVAGIKPDYAGDEESGSTVRLMSVMDITTESLGEIHGTDDFRLAGVELTVPDGADESLALYSKDGLIKVCDIVVSGNDGGLYLTCHLPASATIAKGEYRIRLASHGLDPTSPLAVRTLKVILPADVAPPPAPTVTITKLYSVGTEEPEEQSTLDPSKNIYVKGTNLTKVAGDTVTLVDTDAQSAAHTYTLNILESDATHQVLEMPSEIASLSMPTNGNFTFTLHGGVAGSTPQVIAKNGISIAF